MNSNLTMGSLFSGSGGFELAGGIFGIKTLFESEVEPFPIRVTERNFPDCLQLGDISKINGWQVQKVDIIAGGSPCQDMSIAGKRDGLAGGRSCLFNEQIRIVKEMRESDRNAGRSGKDIRCRWMCWENVPGAFTSNQKQDFQSVLTEIVRVADPQAPDVPIPQKGWPYAGCLMGEHGEWSVAYRTLDAKFWGVPQRRSRIYLVADFGGTTAPQILFERNGLSGDFAESRKAWERAAGHPEADSNPAIGGGGNAYTIRIRSGCEGGGKGSLIQTDMSATLATHSDQTLFQPIAYAFDSTQSNAMKSSNPHSGCREVTVSKTLDASGPDPSKNQGGIAILQPIVLDNHPQDSRVTIREDGVSPTLTEKMGTGGGNVPLILEPMGIQQNADGEVRMYPVSATLNTNGNASGRNAPLVVAPAIAYDCRNDAPNVEVSATLQAKSNGGQSLNYINPVFQPVPINDKATRCEGGGPTRNGDGSGNGLGVGKPGDPAPTLTAADRHGVCYCIQGNMIGRADQNGPQGSGVKEDEAFTLTAADRHAVAYGISRSFFNQGENAKFDPEITEEVAPTLTTSHCPPGVAQPTGVIYIARRFTPLECGRLQGFPDWWADGLGVQDPPSGLVDRWVQIFKTHWETITKATGVKSHKTRNQVIKWLKDPANDSALYKMWGNGIALPCAMFVMEGIAQQSRREETPCHIETQAT